MLQSFTIFSYYAKGKKSQASIEYAIILAFVVLLAAYFFGPLFVQIDTPEEKHTLILQLSLSVKQIFIRVSNLFEKLPELP